MTEQQQTNEQIDQHLKSVLESSSGMDLNYRNLYIVASKTEVLMHEHRERRHIKEYAIVCDERNNTPLTMSMNELVFSVSWLGIDGHHYFWNNREGLHGSR